VLWRRYVTVDKLAGRALYYVFVEAETNPETSPVLLWLNGYAAWLDASPPLQRLLCRLLHPAMLRPAIIVLITVVNVRSRLHLRTH
jgi:enterochelin esterase-like enzyme